MSLLSPRFLAVLAVSGSLLACGPAPKPVSEVDEYANSNPTPQQQQPRALGPGETTMPAGHPPVGPDGGPVAQGPSLATDGGPIWEGQVRLKGELAANGTGFLFVNVKHPDNVVPGYSVKVAVEDGTVDADDLLVPFQIFEGNALGGLVPGAEEILLEACFDHDGYVESKEGQVRRTMPIQVNQSGLEITLEG